MKTQLLFLLLFCGLGSQAVLGQGSLDQLREKEMLNAKLREEEEQRKKAAEMILQRGTEGKKTAEKDGSQHYFNAEKDLPDAEKKLLTADAAEAQKYHALLRQPNTGLFKLLNYRVAKAALTDAKTQFAYPRIRGGGTFYSFAKRNHSADEWAQLRLQDGMLQAAYTEMKRTTVADSGGAQQSFAYTSGYSLALFTLLGNVALDEVTLLQPALQALAELRLPATYQDFVTQQKQSNAGITVGPQRFQSALAARTDMTYLMRSLNYKKADVIIAFRIVRQDADGNLHILWKQLKSFPPAELKGKSAKP